MNNQECKIRPKIINVNNNKPSFYPYSIKINKYSGSCNSINNPYKKLCVPDVFKIKNVKGALSKFDYILKNTLCRNNKIR